MKCLCCSQKNYSACCEPYHKGKVFPKSPEKLMRSRYSAYALGLAPYIIETTHTLSRPLDLDVWRSEIEAFCQKTDFIGLTIEEVKQDFVTFTAKLTSEGVDVSFCEKSLFAKEGGKWVYVSGEISQT